MRIQINQYLYKHGIRYFISLLVLIFFVRYLNREPSMPDPLKPSEVDAIEFFDSQLHGDGLLFTWAHAVNSESKLQEAIQARVHGIEADVVLKNEGTPQRELLPIMAHPPVVRSDLTLRTFLHQTVLGESLIKLDFKSLSAVELSLQMLAQLSDQIKVPVWLNADVLPGPGNSPAQPVDALSFLMKVEASGFTLCTLSLGWTSSYTVEGIKPYNWSHILDMHTALKSKRKSFRRLTFPVNASLMKGSLAPLKWLCEQYDASLTIWQSVADAPVDVNELMYARLKFPKNKIYYDLQQNTMDKLKMADNSSLTAAHHRQDSFSYKAEDWVIKVSNQKYSDLMIGEDVVWLSGAEAQITSSRTVHSNQQVTLQGAVTFVPRKGDKSNLQIFMFGKDQLTNHPSGIRCSIDSRGRMVLASDHLDKPTLYMFEEVGVARDSCYQFELKVKGYSVEFSVYVPETDCHVMQEVEKAKRIKTVLDKKELVVPFPFVIRNSRPDGYAVLHQIKSTFVTL